MFCGAPVLPEQARKSTQDPLGGYCIRTLQHSPLPTPGGPLCCPFPAHPGNGLHVLEIRIAVNLSRPLAVQSCRPCRYSPSLTRRFSVSIRRCGALVEIGFSGRVGLNAVLVLAHGPAFRTIDQSSRQ